jgi:putative DNA methylase
MTDVKCPKKLIEVALPLDDINRAAAKEKSIRHGHPSTLHLWWARRPLAAARAVLFAQLVNDPGYERSVGGRGVNKEEADRERQRLFALIRDLVQWENTNNEALLEQAREEIRKSWRETCHLNRKHPQAAELFDPEKLPGFHDPFAGGGAIPLEAQRLGLEALATDLNPVAVLINKAMIEIPPKFAGRAPVGPRPSGDRQGRLSEGEGWSGARGLAEDVRRYGAWMRDQAQRRIGHLYPQVEVTADMVRSRPDLAQLVGQQLTVIAWLWARTVKSPNPAFAHADVPLVSSFMLSTKAGKEVYVEPVVEGDRYRFEVRVGKPEDPVAAKNGTKLTRGANFQCLLSGSPIEAEHIRSEAQAGRMGVRLLAIVAEGQRNRVYLSPQQSQADVAASARPQWKPELRVPTPCHDVDRLPMYGMPTWGDAFTPRQLVALNTFSDLVGEARARVREDALRAGWPDDGQGLEAGGTGATAYADAVAVYLAFALSKLEDYATTLCRWFPERDSARSTFARQALPMTWDFVELSPLHEATGSYRNGVVWVAECVENLLPNRTGPIEDNHSSIGANAATQVASVDRVVSTDPPYYDNIGYADLSDFFYVWLRRSLRPVFPDLFAPIAVPKTEELIASPYRHNGRAEAEAFFLEGMTRAMTRLAEQAHPALPVTIYYAFKASETKESGTTSTGWVTFLEAVLKAGFAVTGTWPMRTELGNRMIASGTNALASSIVLVCRKRDPQAPTVSRREFLRELNATLPEALADMVGGGEHSPVAPVDLSQAVIGPGMAIFSKYSGVLEADGTPMRVQTALQLINRFFAEEDFEADTQFCLHWFEQYGWTEGPFGEADVLARAKGTSVEGVAEAGVVAAGQGKVRLQRVADYPVDWDPAQDSRVPVWEALHHLIRALKHGGGERPAAALLAQPKLMSRLDGLRQLAYRLYTLCERKAWAEDARAYNELIAAWPSVEARARKAAPTAEQGDLGL